MNQLTILTIYWPYSHRIFQDQPIILGNFHVNVYGGVLNGIPMAGFPPNIYV